MATKAFCDSHLCIWFRLSLLLLISSTIALTVRGQTATYHLHKEASATPTLLQLKTAGPDAAQFAIQSVNLKNAALGEYMIAAFDTQSGVPNAAGVIPAGSTLSFSLWMKKTASAGTMFPRAKLNIVTASGSSIPVCIVTGSTALTTTLTKYTLTITVPNVSMSATDRFYLWVGINLTAKSTQINNAELDIEGTLDGNYDSQITLPLPIVPPAISNISPSAATVGELVTITGTGFGATQGSSTVTFNLDELAAVTAWSDTSITVMAPVEAMTGPVVVRKSGLASNSVTFTGRPKINKLTDFWGTTLTLGPVGTEVTIHGYMFGPTKGTSTITFNGVPAATTSWGNFGAVTTVPAGASTGPIVVTVNGNASNGPIFNVTPQINSVTPNASVVGSTVNILGTGFGVTQGSNTVSFNGVAATPTTWTDTSIAVPVPSGAKGPVVVTVNGWPSEGTFTVVPKIDNVNPNAGGDGTVVTILGDGFGVTPASSTVTFNGLAAVPTAWSNTSISVPVPSGASTGAVVVTESGNASNGVTFTISTSGSLAGTITQTSNGSPISGALIEALQGGVVKSSSSSAANGSYNISAVDTGTYDIRVSANGYQAVTQGGVVVGPNTTTTVDKSLLVDSANEITYVHDELGRLAGAVTPSEVATYSYDDVGNLLSISRASSLAVSIVEFTPNSGGVGAEVTIFGTAFNPTPSQNTVRFNGVAATVRSVTTTQIVATVPAGATTGPISVTTPAGTGVSTTPFVIGNSAPTISSFNPITGDVGTSVVISGNNFDPSFQNNKVKFNLGHSAVTAGTTTSLTTTVRSGAASGRITLMAPEGEVVSSDDFFVAPPGHTASEILVTGRMAIGNVVPITIGTPGKIAILVFDGVAGQRITLGLSGITLGTPCCQPVGATAIYKPDGTALLSWSAFTQDAWGSAVLQLPVTGTYAIVIDAGDPHTGNVTVTLAEELVAPISINGSSVPVNLDRPGQSARLIFSGTAGQRVNLGLSEITLGTPCCLPVGATAIYKPDGTPLLGSTGFMKEGWGSAPLQLPATGTYEIAIDAAYTHTGNVTVTLSEELAVPISINGPPVPLNFNRTGQDARLTFSGTAGQRVSLGLGEITIPGGCCVPVGSVGIYKPDGTPLLSATSVYQGGWGSAVLQLPTNGEYTILIDPGLGRLTATLSEEWVVPISIDGPVLPLNFERGGQIARLPFEGIVGQRVTFGLNGITLGHVCCGNVAGVAIYKPDGTTLLSPFGLQPNIGLGTALLELPITGTYWVSIDPVGAHTGSVTAALSTELTPTITVNGPAVPLDLNRPGHNARPSFTGNAGQLVSVGVTEVTLASSCCTNSGTVGIFKPDGTALLSPTSFMSGYGSATFVLPDTGSYTIPIDPEGMNTGQVAVLVSQDVAAPITINGPTVPVTLNKMTQNGSLTFTGTLGSQVTVRITGNPFGGMTVTVFKPDGTTLISHTAGSTNFNLPTQTLPAPGIYRINIDPLTLVIPGTVTVGLTSP